jgi:hypothetical protein
MNSKFGPSWEKAIIVGIPSKARYRIRREVGYKKVRTINMQKLKPRHCGDGDRPPDQVPEEPGRDTKGRRIPEENESEDENVTEEDRDDNATTEVPQQEETQVQDKKGEKGENKQEQDTESDDAEQENDRTEEGRRRSSEHKTLQSKKKKGQDGICFSIKSFWARQSQGHR